MKKSILSFIIFLISSTVYSQSLRIFNVDASAFPNVKANFYAFDASWNQQSPDKSSLGIKENGLTRYIVNVTSPTPKTPTVLSSVLVMDISNSTAGKNISIAKAAAKAWINALPADNSECALTSFDHFNYFNQDFTTDKSRLLKAINNLSSGGGTDFNKALIDSICGGLRATETGKYQKVLVLMTDGLSSSITDVNKIVAEAKLQKCKIYVVTLDMSCPKELKDISTQTGGQWFENITNESNATETYNTILKIAHGAEPCSISWQSLINCDTADINVELIWKGIKDNGVYPTPSNMIHKLEVSSAALAFGPLETGKSKDIVIKLTAKDVDYTISAINLIIGSNDFQVINVGYPLTIPKNTTHNLTVRFNPSDSNLCYGGFEIKTDYCSSYFSCTGGYFVKPLEVKTLKLTHPNGGESFYINSDTLITWTGVVPSDTVTLEYSVDQGKTWNLITDKATGLKCIWKDVPKTMSNKCLIKISQGSSTNAPSIDWQKTYGGSARDYQKSFQETSEGGFIISGQTQSSDGDVTTNRGAGDCWVVKLNPSGEIEWQKTYGGTGSEFANSVRQTNDGGYILSCTTRSRDGDVTGQKGEADYWIVKLNSSGAIEWQKTLGGSDSEYPNVIIQTNDGGYILTGWTSSKDGDVVGNTGIQVCWLVKLSSTGSIEWQKLLGEGGGGPGSDVKQTTDGGYVVTVGTSTGFFILKLDQYGSMEWQKKYGGISGWTNNGLICQTKDGGYFVTTFTESNDGDINGNHGKTDIWVAKLNSLGELQWQKSLGGSLVEWGGISNLTSDGGYIIGGSTNSNDGDVSGLKGSNDYWCLKLSSTGSIEWQKTLGGSSSDYLYSVAQTKDGRYIAAGSATSIDGDVTNNKGFEDYWIVMLKPSNGFFQSDQSDAVFSIVEPKTVVLDIDMKKCLIGCIKDTLVIDFILNKCSMKFSVDSIYFRGTDAGAFSLVSYFPKYNVLPNSWHETELRFAPKRFGIYKAEMVIITQSDTIVRNITGEGIQPQISIESEIVNFGKVNLSDQKDTLQVLTIKNISKKTIIITNTKINGPNLTDFKTIATVSNFTLKPEETKKIDLRFKPSDIGRTSGILAFYYDGVGSPAEVQLYGEGVMSDSQDLLLPANDTINLPLDCVLKWKEGQVNSTYNLQVSKDVIFNDIIIDTTTKLINYKFNKLDFLHTYYWRVQASIGSEQTNWSPVWKFTTLMDSVTLISPIDLSKNQNVPLNLSWDEEVYKKGYRLQVSEKTNFSSILMDTLISKINNADVKNLKNNNNYYWRVRNESDDTLGYWSQIWQFKTRLSEALLVYPENTQTGLELEINFKWNTVVGAEYYQLQISKNDQFTDLVYSKDSLTTTEQFVPNLEPQILYYWHVRVWNNESIGTEYWSDVWTFRTGELGVNDDSNDIQIIPNPAGDYITINLERCATPWRCGTSGEISIYNTLGEIIMSAKAENFLPLQINISSLPKGIYFVKAGGETAKFVKM